MKQSQYLLVILLFALWSCNQKNTTVLNLSGEWNFHIDSLDRGITEQWFNKIAEETIQLPGSMAENRKGDEITVNTHWTGQIVDKSWFTDKKYERYRQPGNIKIPFWLQPVKKYTGAAWYQKEITIPANWDGKRINLFLERCHWETKVWVDGNYAGMQNSLGTPHEYDLTSLLSPGKHLISILVDNHVKEVNPGVNSHSITDHTQSNWNGIVGEIKLMAQPQTTITDVRIYPDVKNNLASLVIEVNNPGSSVKDGTITLTVKSKDDETKPPPSIKKKMEFFPGSNKYMLEYQMGDDVLLWDEFNPNLYNMNIKLSSDAGTAEKDIQFGMRSFDVSGTRFTINGRPTFLRGTLDCAVFPKTGYPPTDRKEWLMIFKAVKAHGLNHIRFHSWCPPEAACPGKRRNPRPGSPRGASRARRV